MDLLCLFLLCPVVENGSVSLLFCAEGDCGSHLQEAILSAKSVECAFFELDLEQVVDALVKRDARLVLDGGQKGLRPHVRTKIVNGAGYMHNKFCVLDGNRVLTGSFNPTHSANEEQDNVLIDISSPTLARAYRAEFEELWSGVPSTFRMPRLTLGNISIEAYFCPEDSCSLHVQHELLSAKRSIDFLAFSFTSEAIVDAMLHSPAHLTGVVERINAHAGSEYPRLSGFGVDIWKDGNPGMMHHKTFIIDDSVVVTGSFNPTQNADKRNDENLLIIRSPEIAMQFEGEFERVMAEAK
ncbi:MAG: phospholipase D-like domain-containing protein [Nanoarchaeota archaeon]|nr:phospholipase D-like domain-containing protein [Nanoarchaeota archaeon]